MNRLLRRSRSADFDNTPSNPLAPLPVARTPSTAVRGKQVIAAPPAGSSSATLARGAPLPRTALSQVPVTALRTAGSELVPHLTLGAPGNADADAGPSTIVGLPASITHHFPRKLEIETGNYSKWRQLFYFICCKHSVQHHLDVAADPAAASAVWRNDDITVVLWLYEVIAEDLQDVVMSAEHTAHDVWLQLHLLFHENQPGHAIILEAEFCNTLQGDLSIAEYNRWLKALADALRDADAPISD